jgi:large subunit ribosomal protein L9
VNRLESLLKNVQNKKARNLKNAEELKAKLEELTFVIKMRAGEDGRLFGSVTNKDITETIQNTAGVEIDKKNVRIEEPIKMTGTHSIEIHIEQDVNATIKVEVEKEEDK